MYDLLRPGADRRAPGRTRAAALDVGRERLDAVRQALLRAVVPTTGERVKSANPQFAPSENPAAGGAVTVRLVRVKT